MCVWQLAPASFIKWADTYMCHTWTDVSCCCFLWLHFLWMYLSTEVWWAIAIIVINIAYICYDYLFSWCHFVH